MTFYVRTTYGYDVATPSTVGTELKKARREFERVRAIHRTIRRGFVFGLSLVLAQFPFSFLGSEALHVSTSLLGGVMTLATGGVLLFHYTTGEGMPDLGTAQDRYEEAAEMYTQTMLNWKEGDESVD